MSFKKLITLVVILTFIASCKKKEVETDNIFKFREYISFTTSGLSSIEDPIQINLAKDVEGWEMGQELTDNIISITPHVSGKLMIVNKHALIFKPDEALDPGTEYSVTVKLDKIYKDIPKNLGSYSFQFKTITPNFSVSINNLQSYSKNGSMLKLFYVRLMLFLWKKLSNWLKLLKMVKNCLLFLMNITKRQKYSILK